jgi:predicted nucleic acid-binding protein
VTPGSLTLDAGVLIGLDRHEPRAWLALVAAVERGSPPTVPAVVLAQAWRSGRQANLARALDQCRVEPVDERLAKAAGVLCGRTGTADVVDAIVVASAARRGDAVVTTDPDDITALATHAPGVSVIAC